MALSNKNSTSTSLDPDLNGSLLWTLVVRVFFAQWAAFFHWSIVLWMLIGLFGGIFDRFDAILVGLAILLARAKEVFKSVSWEKRGEDEFWMICLFAFIIIIPQLPLSSPSFWGFRTWPPICTFWPLSCLEMPKDAFACMNSRNSGIKMEIIDKVK